MAGEENHGPFGISLFSRTNGGSSAPRGPHNHDWPPNLETRGLQNELMNLWRTRPQAPKSASVPGLGSEETAQSGEVCGPDGTCAVPQR
jgi:hypothetical protein